LFKKIFIQDVRPNYFPPFFNAAAFSCFNLMTSASLCLRASRDMPLLPSWLAASFLLPCAFLAALARARSLWFPPLEGSEVLMRLASANCRYSGQNIFYIAVLKNKIKYFVKNIPYQLYVKVCIFSINMIVYEQVWRHAFNHTSDRDT